MRLRVLGGLSIESGTGETLGGAAARRRPLALLALVAAHGDRGISRERLCALLWPESDAERARNVLNQTVSSLRRELGAPDLFLGVAELRLNPAVLSSDLADFTNALGRGELDRAAELYAGPLLDGVHLRAAPEFERWVEGERARLEQAESDALRRLARQAADLDEHETAVRWWRRLAALDPGDPRTTCGLMGSLEALGDRAGALRQARLHQTYLRQELDVDPDPTVLSYAARLRSKRHPGDAAGGIEEPAAGDVRPASVPPAARPPERTSGSASGAPAGPPATPVGVGTIRRPAFAVAAMVVAASLVAGAAWLTTPHVQPAPPVAIDSTAVVVFPFAVRTGGDAAYLGEALSHLLSSGLHGAGELHVVDPRAVLARVHEAGDTLDVAQGSAMARRFGAGLFVLGDVVRAGDRIRVVASLHGGPDPRPDVRVMAEGRVDDLFVIADSLAGALLAARATGPQPRFVRAAGATTASLPAFRSYLRAERAFRLGDFGTAVALFGRATEEDSTFALARYRLSVAADWAARYDLARAAADRAVRDSLRLSPYYRLLLGALRAQRNAEADEAERLLRRALIIQPEDSEAWYQLSEVLFHLNGARGRSFREARGPLEEVLARSPAHFETLIHLARMAAYDGDRRRLAELLPRVVRSAPADLAFETELLAAFVLGDRRRQESLLARAARLGDVDLHNQCARVVLYTRGRGGGERLCELLIAPERSPEGRALGHWGLAEIAMWRGQRGKARGHLAELTALVPEWGEALEVLHATYPPVVGGRDALRELVGRLERPHEPAPPRVIRHFGVMDGMHPMLRGYLRGYLGLQVGDRQAAAAAIAGLERAAGGDGAAALLARNFALSLEAVSRAAAGDAEGALRLLDRQHGEYMVSERWIGELHTSRFLRADLLARLGREREALGWYGSFGQASIWELGLEGPAALASARIAERLGQADVAAENYRRVVELWANADAELQPAVAEARGRLGAMGG